jgi:hypothetical protein
LLEYSVTANCIAAITTSSKLINMEIAPDVEIWVPVPGFNRFELSSHGRFRNKKTLRIKSLQHNSKSGRPCIAMLPDEYRYRTYFNIKRQATVRAGITKLVKTAPLIALAFLGKRPTGCQIDHIDGDRLNENIRNLAYVTQEVNIQRSYDEQDLHPKETRGNGGRYLTVGQYAEVFRLWNDGHGLSQVKIGVELGMCNSTVSKILARKISCRTYHPRARKLSGMARKARKLKVAARIFARHPQITGLSLAKTMGMSGRSGCAYLSELKGRVVA